MPLKKERPSYRLFHYMNQLFKIALLGVLVSSCIFVSSHVHLSEHFPIKTVRVYGVNRIDRQEIQAFLTPLVQRGFFSVDVECIRSRLLQQPWVSNVFVRRNWPDQIDVTMVERRAVARWHDQTLLSDTGVLFTPKEESLPAHLPTLVGPDGNQMIILNYFNEINRLLVPLHAKISYLELTPYLTWKLILDTGITLQIGHKDILTRLNHFVRVYPKIIGDRAMDVDSIDLRYPNGVAVKWKQKYGKKATK